MAPLAVLAFYLYYSGVGVCIRLSKIKRVCDSDELFDAALKNFITSRELPHDAKKISRGLEWNSWAGWTGAFYF